MYIYTIYQTTPTPWESIIRILLVPHQCLTLSGINVVQVILKSYETSLTFIHWPFSAGRFTYIAYIFFAEKRKF